ncbi:MAG: serine hydrolase, partial [Actinomycetota bacterium]|nr:serine hydrolase [Actinomycetota bacterium]
FAWPANPDGISIGWGELMIAPRDLARFGQLVLDGGRWGGEQIAPEEWIAEATHPRIDATLQDDYGYQWWIRDDGVVEALGYQGQYVIIDRERDIVAVFASTLPDDEFFVPDALYDTFIAPAVVSNESRPPAVEGDDALEAARSRYSG